MSRTTSYFLKDVCAQRWNRGTQTDPTLRGTGGLGWCEFYHTRPFTSRPGGTIGALCVVEPDHKGERPSHIGDVMLANTLPVIQTHIEMVDALTRFREEWEQAVEGESLLEARGSVGLMLGDVVGALRLSPKDQAHVLGEGLYADLQEMLVPDPANG